MLIAPNLYAVEPTKVFRIFPIRAEECLATAQIDESGKIITCNVILPDDQMLPSGIQASSWIGFALPYNEAQGVILPQPNGYQLTLTTEEPVDLDKFIAQHRKNLTWLLDKEMNAISFDATPPAPSTCSEALSKIKSLFTRR